MNEADLNQLQTQLKKLAKTASEYARLLRNLKGQRHTIAINTHNYTDTLRIIGNKLVQEHNSGIGNDLSFLESFSNKCHHFQAQIQADLGYAIPGSSLLEQAIASIRGIVAIDQAERDRQRQEIQETSDRKLENTIAVVGVGLAVTEIVGGSTPYLISQDTPKPIQPPFTSATLHPFAVSLLLSLSCGLLATVITWILIKQLHSNKKQKLPQSKSQAKLQESDRTSNQ